MSTDNPAGNRFDEQAALWDLNPVRAELARRFAQAVRAHLPAQPGMAALELGCGTGLVSLHLHDALGHIDLVDTSRGMLDVLDEKIRRAGITTMTTHHGDLAALAMPAKSYALIYSSMTLHHVPDIPPLLAECRRLLQPGGMLCVADLEPEDGSFHGEGEEVHHGFEVDALKGMLAFAGLEPAAEQRLHVVQKPGSDGILRDYPVFFLTARKKPHPVP